MAFVENTLELRQRILSINLSNTEGKSELIKEYLEYQIDSLTQHHQQMISLIWDAQELYFQNFKSYYSNLICNADDKFIGWANFIEENLILSLIHI